jgi:metallo-beta-lactamase family protein
MKKTKGARNISRRKLNEIKALLKKNPNELNVGIINNFIEQHRLEGIQPLYTSVDAEQSLEYFDSYPYHFSMSVGRGIECTFYDAGHILGSAFCFLKFSTNGGRKTVCYTGDIGRFEKPILKDPTLEFHEEDREIDLLIMESTYGDRSHEPVQDLKARLKQVLIETYQRRGSLLIPAFAFGRTQTLLYTLHELYRQAGTPQIPIYVDSPLAVNLTRVFGEHPEVYDQETHNTFLEKGENPFDFDQIHFVTSVEQSMALNREKKPHIVIAASGMCEAGRILHHLRHKIHNPRNTILLVGYMAMNTLGRRIEDEGLAYAESGRKGEPPTLRFLNKQYPLRAHVTKIGGFSAHADRDEMLRFLKESNLRIKQIALVHGEESQSLTFAQNLGDERFRVTVPHRGGSLQV